MSDFKCSWDTAKEVDFIREQRNVIMAELQETKQRLYKTEHNLQSCIKENKSFESQLKIAIEALEKYQHFYPDMIDHAYYWRCEACSERPLGKAAREALSKIQEIGKKT